MQTRVQTAFPMQEAAEPYNKRRAIHHLEKGELLYLVVLVLAQEIHFFTTDTASALRASERMSTYHRFFLQIS